MKRKVEREGLWAVKDKHGDLCTTSALNEVCLQRAKHFQKGDRWWGIKHTSGLLSVNRQIRLEAEEVFCKTTVLRFEIDGTRATAKFIKDTLKSLSPRARTFIREIRLGLKDHHKDPRDVRVTGTPHWGEILSSIVTIIPNWRVLKLEVDTTDPRNAVPFDGGYRRLRSVGPKDVVTQMLAIYKHSAIIPAVELVVAITKPQTGIRQDITYKRMIQVLALASDHESLLKIKIAPHNYDLPRKVEISKINPTGPISVSW